MDKMTTERPRLTKLQKLRNERNERMRKDAEHLEKEGVAKTDIVAHLRKKYKLNTDRWVYAILSEQN